MPAEKLARSRVCFPSDLLRCPQPAPEALGVPVFLFVFLCPAPPADLSSMQAQLSRTRILGSPKA